MIRAVNTVAPCQRHVVCIVGYNYTNYMLDEARSAKSNNINKKYMKMHFECRILKQTVKPKHIKVSFDIICFISYYYTNIIITNYRKIASNGTE